MTNNKEFSASKSFCLITKLWIRYIDGLKNDQIGLYQIQSNIIKWQETSKLICFLFKITYTTIKRQDEWKWKKLIQTPKLER